MNNINITVELCAADRERLDLIIGKLEALAQQRVPACDKCVKDVAGVLENACEAIDSVKQQPGDKALEALRATVSAEPAKNAQEAPEVIDHPTLDPFPEVPTVTEDASETKEEETKLEVTMEMLRSKAIALAAAGKKDQVRAVVHPYATKVTDIPADKWAEVYKKLTELEG